MSFSVDCACGRRIAVTTSMAGSEVACLCGVSVRVPSLSVLRQQAGQGAYDSGPADVILREYREHRLPTSDRCAGCGSPTDSMIECYVQVEQAYQRRKSNPFLVAFLISPLIALFMEDQPPVLEGRDTFVPTPLRMDQGCQARLGRRPSQRRLKSLVRMEPAYARLLDAYPRARVFLGAVPVDPGIRTGSTGDPK